MSVKEVLDLYDAAKKYVANSHRTKWDQYYRVYKGDRVFRNYQGIADPSIRESHTIVETLVANIAGGNIKFHYTPTTEEQSRDITVLNEALDYYMKCNRINLKAQEWVREMVLYGNGVLLTSWEDGKPILSNIPLRDFFVDPTSTGLVKTNNPARYAGYEYLADRETLESAEIFDSEKGEWTPRYTNLDKVGYDTTSKSGGSDDNKGMDKAFKDMFNGSTLLDKAAEHQIHVIQLHHLPTGKIYEVGNRKEFISVVDTWCQRKQSVEDTVEIVNGEEIPTKRILKEIKPFLPFAVLRDYIDSSQFYAEGEMALIIGDAELANDYEAMMIDNNAYQNTPMYWVDPQYADIIPDIETIPGAVYPIPKNAIGALERPQLTTDLDNKQEKTFQRMRRATAADEAVQGGSTGNSRTTATEVSTQLQQAQMRFSTKIQNLESEGFAQVGEILIKLMQIFLTKKTAIRIVGKNGVYFKDYDPWEYDGEWEVSAELDSTIKQKQMEVGQKDNQIYEILSNDPQGIFNPVEIKRWMLQKIDPSLSDDKFNALLAPPKDAAEDVKDIGVINYKDATPRTKAQMEIKAGYQPDPIHEVEAKMMELELAGRGVDILDPRTDTQGRALPGVENALTPQEQITGQQGVSGNEQI